MSCHATLKNDLNGSITVYVWFLDEHTHKFTIQKDKLTRDLLKLIFEYLNLTENHQYFGIQFIKLDDVVRWAEPESNFHKKWLQTKDAWESEPNVKFAVKFFVKDPCKLCNEETRRQFYLQIKHDIFKGKLPCSIRIALLLASFIAQSELGDYIEINHNVGYLSCLPLIRGQNEEFERRVSELHKLHRGQLPANAEFNYLDTAKRLEMYGLDLHKVMSDTGEVFQIGVSATGLVIYKDDIRVKTLPWSTSVIATSFSGSYFEIKIKREPNEACDKRLKFTTLSSAHAKSLWKSCNDHFVNETGCSCVPETKTMKRKAREQISKIFGKVKSKASFETSKFAGNKNQKNKCKQTRRQPKVTEAERESQFQESLAMLNDALNCNSLETQYKEVNMKNPVYPITEAAKAENSSKNRYSNIQPYDCTRVILHNSGCNNYINASYVNLDIGNITINRFIATQGPLEHTTLDFWRMVQQESSTLILMLTSVFEEGIEKCHKYWPNLGDKQELSKGFWIKCITEQPDETGSFVLREIKMFDKNIDQKRTIQHMQYLAWPAQGVPCSSELFLRFIKGTTDVQLATKVHEYITETKPATIIHCSGGIGRTGVVILMDTALMLLDAREPIYPRELLKRMRDQRPGLIQNYKQFQFVCECLYEVYTKLDRK